MTTPLLRRALVGTIGIGLFACGSSRNPFDIPGASTDDSPNFSDSDAGVFGGGGELSLDGGGPLPSETRDPVDCNEAKTTRSYVGCDYWPTVTANNVWSIFDFAVIVANTGTTDANVTVTGANSVNINATVPPGEVKKIYLPWVPSLKGADADECGAAAGLGESVVQPNGAYHLVSSTPVIVYQFNALEYKGQGGEGANGGAKDWSACPGTVKACAPPLQVPTKFGCFSFSNDASLLLPSTAMTSNYRVTGVRGWTETATDIMGGSITVTATEDATDVKVTLSSTGAVLAGGDLIAATPGGGNLQFTLAHAGDVAEIVTDKGAAHDLSGSLVTASKPVQVITGIACVNVPAGSQACDHVEESTFPAETMGKRYVVTGPTSPKGAAAGHVVRLYGNVDGTTLTYSPQRPGKCPATLNAGEVADCDVINTDFEVSGDHEFAVGSFMLGAAKLDPTGSDLRGDPSQTLFPAVEQYRTKYLFLAPDDYDVSYADIVGTADALVQIDGQPITAPFKQIGAGPFGVWRVKLTGGKGGAHTLTSKRAVGLQVLGYGANTSYQVPGGLNLNLIAPPPK